MVTLESSRLFAKMPLAAVEWLGEAVEEQALDAGTPIFEIGDPGDGIYIVKEGVVEISGGLNTGDRQTFATVRPGDFFGEMAALDNEPRSASARAREDSIVYFIPRERMARLIEENPGLAVRLIQETSRRLRDFNQQYMKAVLRSERMALVGGFANSIVHDLKNPLTIISLSAETACSPNATPELKSLAKDRIRRQVDHINSMVNDILEFTRGSQTSQVSRLVDYKDFLQDLLKELQQDTLGKSIQLQFQPPPNEVKLPINPKRLTRVFINLITNAADALKNQGTITVTFRETPDQVITDISDTGPGIPEQVMANLFEPFVTQGKSKGTGLGLSICHRIILEHGGTLTARNQPGGGATFSIRLPKHR